MLFTPILSSLSFGKTSSLLWLGLKMVEGEMKIHSCTRFGSGKNVGCLSPLLINFKQ